MANQDDTCWRCATTWTSEPQRALRLIDGGAAPDVQPQEVRALSTADRLARLVAEARA